MSDFFACSGETRRSQIIRCARCTACSSREVKLMRDMATHYRPMRDESGFDPTPRQGRT